MEKTITILPELRAKIRSDSRARVSLCYNCGACDSGCPMNLATGLLWPRRLVHMANIGHLDSLCRSPEIWYCLMCNRCANNCPMTVKPSELIAYLRLEAIKQHVIPYEAMAAYRSLMIKFQRVRWHMAHHCMGTGELTGVEESFGQWMEKDVFVTDKPVNLGKSTMIPGAFARNTGNGLSCFTCGECSSACPVSAGRDVFDPVWIFRMINLGLLEELAASPSIWLCLGCERCTQACSQGVRGHELIEAIRNFAVQEKIVGGEFLSRWEVAQQKLNGYLKDEIDRVFDHHRIADEVLIK